MAEATQPVASMEAEDAVVVAEEQQQLPGMFWPVDSKKKKKHNSGASWPTIALDAATVKELKNIAMEQISGDDFDNKPVDTMLLDLARAHIANHTGMLDWHKYATPSKIPLRMANGKVFVDTVVVRCFVPMYHTQLVRKDQTEQQPGDQDAAVDDGVHMLAVKSEIAQFIHRKVADAFESFGIPVERRNESDERSSTGPRAIGLRCKDVQMIGGLRCLGEPLKKLAAEVAKKRDAPCTETVPPRVALERMRVEEEKRLLCRLRDESKRTRENRAHPKPPLRVVDQNVHQEDDTTQYCSQYVKIATSQMDAKPVIDLVHSGALKDLGFYHCELDTSGDCCGSVRLKDVEWSLVNAGTHVRQYELAPVDSAAYDQPDMYSHAASRPNVKGCITDSDGYTGRNCTSIMHTGKKVFNPLGLPPLQMPEKQKAYMKLVCNLESEAVRQAGKVGWHGLDNAALMFDRVSRSLVLPECQQRGVLRIENTVWSKGVAPDVAHLYTHSDEDEVRAALQDTMDLISPELVQDLPHHQLWKTYCENLKHIPVFVHSRYDRAAIVYSTNELTNKVSGTVIYNWSRHYRYILERCAFGKKPMDVISIHTGRDVPRRRAKQPRKPRASRALSKQEKLRRKRKREREKARGRKQPRLADASSLQPTDPEATADQLNDETASIQPSEITESTTLSGKRASQSRVDPMHSYQDQDNGYSSSDEDSDDSGSESDEESDGSEDNSEAEEGATDHVDAQSIAAESTAADDDAVRYDYKPGWIAPDDPCGAVITSQRLWRAPKDKKDLEEDGSFFPETRLVQKSPGVCFKPDGKESKRCFSGAEGQLPFVLPQGYNDDSTHIEDVGVKEGPRRPDIEVAQERQANGGMAPNEHCKLVIFPPPKPATKRQNYAHIIASSKQLPICKRAALNSRALAALAQEHKGETQADRLQRLLRSLDAQELCAERDNVLDEQRHFMESHSFKEQLRGTNRNLLALADIPEGENALIAVELRGKLGDLQQTLQQEQPEGPAKYAKLAFHVGAPDGSTKAYASRKVFDFAFRAYSKELDPLLNKKGAHGKMPCYMHADATGASIGTLTRHPTGAFLNRHGRTTIDVDVALTLPDGSTLQIIDRGKATRTLTPDATGIMDADSATVVESVSTETTAVQSAHGASEMDVSPQTRTVQAPAALPSIERPKPCPRSEFRKISDVLGTIQRDAGGVVVTVLNMGDKFVFNQNEWLPLKVRIEGDHPHAGEHTAISLLKDPAIAALRGYDIADLHGSINSANNTLFVYNVTSTRGVACELVDPGELWWKPAAHSKHAYQALPQLAKQMPSAPQDSLIVAVKTVKNARRDKDVPIVKMQDGKIYSFAAPQTTSAFKLRDGHTRLRLDTDQWRVTPV